MGASLPFLLSAQQKNSVSITKRVLRIPEVTVVGKRPMKDIGVQRTRFDSVAMKENIALSMADVLTFNSSVFVKNSGGASLSTVAFRGTSPSHTQVTWNGMRINNPMLGMTDFSTIPSYFIDDASLLHGTSSVNETGGGLGGLVKLSTAPANHKGFQDVMPGIASSYIFTLKPGDKVTMSGPYGDFHPIFDSKREMMWVGGGAGMAPLRAQIMHMTKTLKTTDRKMSYFYGARALNEVFYLEDFLEIEKEFPNFTFHLALDRPDPAADAAGVKYTAGFVHQVIYDTYLKDHEAPEDIEYYMCGPGPMSKAVENMLDNLGVPREMLHFDDFGA